MTMRDVFGDGPATVTGTLRGYRSWGAVNVGGQLRSTGMCHHWRPRAHTEHEVAKCLAGMAISCPSSPGEKCGCGLYGWYDPDDQKLVAGSVFGAIEVAGRVQIGTHGFRAERARVLGVWSPVPTYAEQLRRGGYRVFDSREALLEALPPDDVSSIVDHRCEREHCAADAMGRPAASSVRIGLSTAVQAAQAAAGAAAQVMVRRLAAQLATAHAERTTPVLRREVPMERRVNLPVMDHKRTPPTG